MAFLLTAEGGFVFDLRTDVHAFDGQAATLLRPLLAGEPLPHGTQAFIDGLVREGLLTETRNCLADDIPGMTARALAAVAEAVLAAGAGWLAILAAKTSFSINGWPATFAAWKRRSDRKASAERSLEAISAMASRAAARDPSGADCKERALTAWMLARTNGHEASLIIGARPHPLAAHSWCEVGGHVVGDTRERVSAYTPVFRYG